MQRARKRPPSSCRSPGPRLTLRVQRWERGRAAANCPLSEVTAAVPPEALYFSTTGRAYAGVAKLWFASSAK